MFSLHHTVRQCGTSMKNVGSSQSLNGTKEGSDKHSSDMHCCALEPTRVSGTGHSKGSSRGSKGERSDGKGSRNQSAACLLKQDHQFAVACTFHSLIMYMHVLRSVRHYLEYCSSTTTCTRLHGIVCALAALHGQW